jgi:hypothetical protein
MSTRILITFLVAASLLNLNACTYETVEGSTMSEEYDPSDPHWDVKQDAASPSGGVSAGVDLVTGQETPSTGPQAWFKNEAGNPIAQAYTVRFTVQSPSQGATPQDNIFDCVATVIATVQGNQIQRRLTVGTGVAITGEAESVSVSLQDITPDAGQLVNQPGGGTAPFGNPYRVAVVIAPGVRANYTLPPTLEAFTDIVEGVASVQSGAITVAPALSPVLSYPIPQDAGINSVEVLAVTAGTALAAGSPLVYVEAGATGLLESKRWDPTLNKGFIALPPNATELLIFVNLQGLGAQATITVTWGIEG